MFLISFFAIMLPIYIFIGLQPVPIADAASLPKLSIDSINLETPVTTSELINRELTVPDRIAGIYTNAENKLFILGHSSTVFKNLEQVQLHATIIYNDTSYTITSIETLAKSDISMLEILKPEVEETLVIMTCAGTPLPNQDATHRLIVTAVRNT